MFYEKHLGNTSFFLFSELEKIPDLVQAFTTRKTDNVVKDAEGDGEVASGKKLFLSNLGIPLERVVQLKQVHSDRVVRIPPSHSGQKREADGVLLTAPGYFAVIKTADCLPVIAFDPAGRNICALHAGWRGTRERITQKGVARFLEATGVSADQIVVAFGPSIRRCCYEVGPEVMEQFRTGGHNMDAISSGRHLDIVAANRLQLEALGVSQVLDSGMCTACRNDLFYSYRREGETGRLWALAGFRRWHDKQ